MTQASSPPPPPVANEASMDNILQLCADGQDIEKVWDTTEPSECLAIIEALLNLEPILEACEFSKDPFISDDDGGVVEELRVHWSYDDYSDLSLVFRPFLALAFDGTQAVLSANTVNANAERFNIGPRKYLI